MHYVKQILLPGEQVLYDGRVHPIVFAGGLCMLAVAAWILMAGAHTGGGHSMLISFARFLAQNFPSTIGFYDALYRWQEASPGSSPEIKILGLGIALAGFSRLMHWLVIVQSTELVVTDGRIISKRGVMTIITAEMSRHRIAEIVVDQTLLGRLLGYGHIFIRGFTGTIGGLPPMADPHALERFVLR